MFSLLAVPRVQLLILILFLVLLLIAMSYNWGCMCLIRAIKLYLLPYLDFYIRRFYFVTIRSKADISQLHLPHKTSN